MSPRASRPPTTFVAAMRTIGMAAVASSLAACGGDSSTSTSTVTSTTEYLVGGTISGLTVSSLVLANEGAAVTIDAGVTDWEFTSYFAPGTSYSVTIQTQPVGELCEVASGASGTDTGDVGNVVVVCGFGQWTWEAGANTVNASGVYGTLGATAASNVPGGRYWTSSWTDKSHNFWMFGGVGYDSTGASGYLNDLWLYVPSTGQWTWVSGGNGDNASGVYGSRGTAAAGNIPGARQAAGSWTDASGNLWMFGGYGYDATGGLGSLNDLWMFNPGSAQWTWVGGGNGVNASGVYGTQGTAAAGNVPGARYSAATWIDSSGNLWLFGGVGYDAAGGLGNLNDLWRYSPGSGQWTWISGGSGDNAIGVYGTQGTAAASNLPGARYSASTWIDSSGNLWLFGGYGYASTSSAGKLNDLWEYSASSGQWTYVSGYAAVDIIGTYGTLGIPATGQLPGAREAASSWIDSSGNLWLFGGNGYGATGVVGNLNDAWRYSPSTAEWTWVSGADAANPAGVYGTLGTGSPAAVPGGRNSLSNWIDSSGNLWLFGGAGYDSNGNLGYLNDLWRYNPNTGT